MTLKNIGILAHVDAGKTTLTEQLLYHTGAIRQPGRVDDGNTQTDTLELERERGISIKSMPTSYQYNDQKINIIDTPGHADFIAEVERALILLDGAVLVISAREAVQSHTRLLFNALQRMQIPIMLFINKIDRMGVDPDVVLHDIRTQLSPNIYPLQKVINPGGRDVQVRALSLNPDDNLIEMLSTVDESLLLDYLNDEFISENRLRETLQQAVAERTVYPVLFGSALQSIGLPEMLDGINTWLPSFTALDTDVPSGVVASILRLPSIVGRCSVIQVTAGEVRQRDTIGEDKITRLFQFNQGEIIPVDTLVAGDTGIAIGLHHLNVGDTFGAGTRHQSFKLGKPALRVRLEIKRLTQRHTLLKALTLMAESDPYLSYELNSFNDDIYIMLFGYVQMEIVQETLKREYDLDVEMLDPMTIFMETLRETAEAIITRDEGLPFYAGIGFRVEPLPPGSGIEYCTDAINMGGITRRYKNGIRDGVMEYLDQGLYGWELTDIRITLIHYDLFPDTTPAEYRDLAPLALFEALANAGTKLLQPISAYELTIPTVMMGRAMTDLQRMKASFDEPMITGDTCMIQGQVPMENCQHYTFDVQDYTGGVGHFETRVIGYEDAPADKIVERARFKIDPANRGLYLRAKGRY
ncbi:MAG: GTP-binding protein [Aggregatilineales bacterium]